MKPRSVATVTAHRRIDGVVPGVRGQRAFPTQDRPVLDPFVMLDHIGPQRLEPGFFVDGVMHPHRGFETLTMMFEGQMHHVDSTGFREELRTGSTQNMIAGRGIQHGGSMEADADTHVFHEVQLWVNMPASTKMRPPSISSAHAGDKPTIDNSSHVVEVITGSVDGRTSPLETTQSTRIVRVLVRSEAQVVLESIPDGWTAAVYVLKGRATVGGRDLSEFALATFASDGDCVVIDSPAPGSELLIVTGEPIGEPVAMGGPWVMNTRQELEQANADLADGLI